MGEIASDEVGDGDQMSDGAVTTCLGLGGLDLAVRGLGAGVGQLGVKSVEDALPVVLEALGDLFDRFDAAASSPAVPSLQQRLGTGTIVGAVEDLTQRLLDPGGAMGFEVTALEVVELENLVVCP